MSKSISLNKGTIDFLINFLCKITTKIKDNTIRKYIIILGSNPDHFVNNKSENYFTELKKISVALVRNWAITREIHAYSLTKISKLEYLNNFSEEQNKYITSPIIEDSKLIACAGSGKTRSIIGRIKFMVDHHLAKQDKIFAITFSKHAATDFHEKIKALFPDHANFCDLKNFTTIDSLAKSILCRVKSHKSENVEILSIAFRNFLKEITPSDIEFIKNIKNIKHLFIDEAQDLNETQYEIAILLKEKFDTKLHLIGDPNQNIYQFRRSSSSYLVNFIANKFELTLNFRSSQEIIDFSEKIKPVNTSKSISATGKHGPKVTVITKNSDGIHKLILHFINLYRKKCDLSNVAIICPTRGIGNYESVGLSVFFNFLNINKIPFNQLYDESGLNNDRKKDVGKIPGHINLITYHGTKGLEFDVVFVMDFYYFLFNIKPTEEEHNINRYLLYVATSRAISMMFICTYTNTHGGYLNHWITKVPPEYYYTDSAIKIPCLAFRDKAKGQPINGITELIGELNENQLNTIDDMIEIREENGIFTKRIYQDFTHIDRGKDESLFGIFCEELFYLQYFLSHQKHPRKLSLIQSIIESKFVIIENDSDYKILKNYITQSQLTWEKYDMIKNSIQERLCGLIEQHFDRNKEINDCIICTNSFIKIIELNMEDIKNTYQKYLNSASYDNNYKKILEDLFYLIVVQYAYDNNHYYYICNHGKEKHYLLENGAELFEKINNYVSNNYFICDIDPKINVEYPKMMLLGEIDFIEKYRSINIETIVEIKCVKEISIKYYIQLLLYNFCYYHNKNMRHKLFNNRFKIINLLTGLEHQIIINISPTNMFNLLIILADIGNLTFNNLNLVYDLETTNLIESIGPVNGHCTIPRCEAIKKGGKYFGKVYPEITEISIKDYDTDMILINKLVKPRGNISLEVQKVTGITPNMLKDKSDINEIRTDLEYRMKNFINCKMMAHNGNIFDNKIMIYDKLIDLQKVSFLDTLSIIPIHMPPGKKLISKKLENIYHQLFGKSFKAHRAMADVEALIKIMRYLRVKF